MAFAGTGKIWMNGSLVNWSDAKIHIASHVIHYGSGVFEGARCYATPKGSACFRLDTHVDRLLDSAKIYRMDTPHTHVTLEDAILETIRANEFKACYIRPIIYRGYEALGVNPFPCPVDVAILLWEWGKYLGDDALEKGVDVKVSSWTRMAPNTFPSLAKSSANYANSGLIKMEAIADGYAEGLALDSSGYLSEGSGENVFLVRHGVVYTPPLTAAILPGITRDSVITLARDLGYRIREEMIPREMLYIADEVFFAGTAVEITPIRSVDRLQVGNGRRGPVTEALQRAFFDVINGEVPDTHGWLTYVYPAEAPLRAMTEMTGPAKAGAGKSR
jgi:branched-chain amino acid aminotransferase